MIASKIQNLEDLEDRLSEPTDRVVDVLAQLEGDILVLGAGGKMGPSLARMAQRASDIAGTDRQVFAVSRFSNSDVERSLNDWGVKTIRGDLFDDKCVAELPDVANIVYLTGVKFGTSDNPGLTWATNSYLPAVVCRRFPASRIASLSSGNIYGLIPVESGSGSASGSVEGDPLNPLGEYSMSCLGRERVFDYFSRSLGTPVSLIRLNYATEMRYGVLVDMAQQVLQQQPISLATGYANVLWQGDANALALCALQQAASPPSVMNITGPERVSYREVYEYFGRRFEKKIHFSDDEGPTAQLSDASHAFELFGRPRVTLDMLLEWTANWVLRGGPTSNMPTHFEGTDGKY